MSQSRQRNLIAFAVICSLVALTGCATTDTSWKHSKPQSQGFPEENKSPAFGAVQILGEFLKGR